MNIFVSTFQGRINFCCKCYDLINAYNTHFYFFVHIEICAELQRRSDDSATHEIGVFVRKRLCDALFRIISHGFHTTFVILNLNNPMKLILYTNDFYFNFIFELSCIGNYDSVTCTTVMLTTGFVLEKAICRTCENRLMGHDCHVESPSNSKYTTSFATSLRCNERFAKQCGIHSFYFILSLFYLLIYCIQAVILNPLKL